MPCERPDCGNTKASLKQLLLYGSLHMRIAVLISSRMTLIPHMVTPSVCRSEVMHFTSGLVRLGTGQPQPSSRSGYGNSQGIAISVGLVVRFVVTCQHSERILP